MLHLEWSWSSKGKKKNNPNLSGRESAFRLKGLRGDGGGDAWCVRAGRRILPKSDRDATITWTSELPLLVLFLSQLK